MFARKKKKPASDGAEGAKKAAISLLAYKENTERELYDKLTDRGYSDEEASEALNFVKARRYLDEARYFRRFVEGCACRRYYGKKRILQEAHLKKFSPETLNTANDLFEEYDFASLCAEALVKLDKGEREKTVQALLRRGYGTAEIRKAFDIVKGEV